MASRYSPGVLPDDGFQYATEGAAAGLAAYFQGARQRKLDQEQAERDALDEAIKKGEMHQAGYRRGTAPQQSISSELTTGPGLESRGAFDGQGMGMQPQGGPQASPLAQNVQRAGMARLGSFQASPAPAAPASSPTATPDDVLALPGAFVPEVGGFTSTPIFKAPALPQMPPSTMQVADPSKQQLTDDWYLDMDQTPEARERAAAGEERSRVSGALSRFRGMSPEKAQEAMQLLEAGIPASVVFQDQADDVTVEELIAAGVPPEIAPLAARDQALARQYLAPPDAADQFNPDTDVPLQRALEMERRRRAGELPRTGAAGDEPYDPATDEVLQRALEMERLRDEGTLPRPGGGAAGGAPEDAPSFAQAYDIVQQRYAKRATASPLSPITGYELEEAEMVNRARALARGDDPDVVLQPAPIDSASAAAADTVGADSTDEPGLIARGIQRLSAFFNRANQGRAARRTQQEGMPEGAAVTRQAPLSTARKQPAAAAPAGDSIAQARDALQGLPPTVQRSLLRQQGYTPEEIEQIVGGGGG